MTVLELCVPAVSYEDDVLADVLLDDEPRSATETKPLALTDGVEPVAAMRAYHLASLDVNDAAFLFTHETAKEIVVVYLTEEADALTVFPSCRGESRLDGNVAHLLLHQVADGEDCVTKLLIRELCQEVSLILHRIFGSTQPKQITFYSCGIMPCGDKVVVLANPFLECTKLNKTVAHHIGIWGESLFHTLYRIPHHLFPIFLLQVCDFQLQTILTCRSLRKFNIFFSGA